MINMDLAEAQLKLPSLVDLAETGETVCITKDGKPVAQIVAMQQHKTPFRPIDVEALRRSAASTTYQEEGAGDFMRRMRDEDRY